ncbi:ABC transporter substrate-binding protein [Compostimonas suwonensis]|uniref:Branched-chain amino acid transport system substrate-binding protein n=1 Tax=Compostimonas suwonensis TaxID=1048394 RepID=A0A2M9BCD9_9MICO|nr:ABC transporter substrate-binding protein [Compostimonas suwonensis]PJJ55607.1 branched-chain amino acid transport system substrate-binding protein [Compostimonas suwonensis]
MSRSTRITLVTSTAAILLLLAGCAPVTTDGGSGSGSSDSGSPIKVGYLGALSGGSAANGQSDLNGVQLAVDQLNEAGGIAGRQLEVVTADDKSDPATSATAAQKLVQQDGVVAVLGGPNSGTVKANSVIVTGANVPRIITIAQEDTLIDPAAAGFPLTFRVTENNTYDVDAIASVFEQKGYQAICVLADTTAYGEGGLTTINTVFAKHDLPIHAVARHEVNATDMTAPALTLRDAGCDSIYLYSLGPDGALFLKTLQQIGWDVPVIGGRGLAAKSFLSLAGDAANGVIIPAVVDPSKAEGGAFIDAYDAAYGADDDPAHVYSAMGYDSMNMLAAALEETDGEGGDALAKALGSVELTDAASGREGSTLSFSTDRHEAPSKDFLVLYEIKDGAFSFLSSDVESGQ